MNEQLKEKLELVPKTPGVYLWKDADGEVIYVGKAINLFNRVHQYFIFPQNVRRTLLAANIADLDYVTTKNDNEAFVLENNLIKKYQPKYNVLLKDGSNYPYILLTNEPNPRLLYTRNVVKGKGKYYGPISAGIKNKFDIYNLVQQIFPLRKCKTIPHEKCLYYDLGLCLGPCIKTINPDTYKEIKKQIDDFFHGKYKEIADELAKQEEQLATNLNFEQAQQKHELIESLKTLKINQSVQLTNHQEQIDIVAYKVIENQLGIVIFGYVDGKLLNKFDALEQIYDDNDTDSVANYLLQYYEHFSLPSQLYISLDDNNIKLLENALHIPIKNPTQGAMQDIMLNALNNANVIIQNKLNTKALKIARTLKANDELRQHLGMDQLKRIEIFDNSHIMNMDRVGAMVCYENGVPNKKLYRKYIIRNQESQSDVQYMEEVLTRRYSKLQANNEPLPDLIIVDGGKLQVEVANRVLKNLKLDLLVNVIGLKKNDHHKTNCIVLKNLTEIPIDKKSDLYFFLLNMQEEVDRFAKSFFRDKHLKSMYNNELNDIKGLGKKRKADLMQAFNNLQEIKNATFSQLCQVVPKNVAAEIIKKFSEN